MMPDMIVEIQDNVCCLTMNRVNKYNAFDNKFLNQIHQALNAAIDDPGVRVIVLKAHGKHFSAGADVSWMQGVVHLSEQENYEDAMVLANLMHRLNQCPKPTIAMVQGAAFGGGAGLVAACDIAIAASSARFCFSEVKLGLIPAVISPYVVQAIGVRAAKMLFMSAEVFDAPRALELQLIQHCLPEERLLDYTMDYARQISKNAPKAVEMSKQLVTHVANQSIDEALVQYTASLIAQKRTSEEGQRGLQAFLNKETPNW